MNIELVKRFSVTLHNKEELALFKRWLLDMNGKKMSDAFHDHRLELIAFIGQRQMMPAGSGLGRNGETRAIISLTTEEFDSFAKWVKETALRSGLTEGAIDSKTPIYEFIRAILFTR